MKYTTTTIDGRTTVVSTGKYTTVTDNRDLYTTTVGGRSINLALVGGAVGGAAGLLIILLLVLCIIIVAMSLQLKRQRKMTVSGECTYYNIPNCQLPIALEHLIYRTLYVCNLSLSWYGIILCMA